MCDGNEGKEGKKGHDREDKFYIEIILGSSYLWHQEIIYLFLQEIKKKLI